MEPKAAATMADTKKLQMYASKSTTPAFAAAAAERGSAADAVKKNDAS
jgi:hypothetical protein